MLNLKIVILLQYKDFFPYDIYFFFLWQVSWVRLRDINLLAINEVTNTKDKRIKAIHVPESDRWSLRIQDTQLSDDGPYECQVTSRQVAKVVHLKVLGESNASQLGRSR